ncbi:MAG: NAD-dependent epimerase/dehydratase family protein [Rhodothermales bacterium]
MNPPPVFLVTGAMGCIGAWALRHLVHAGHRVVSFDLSDTRHRVDMLLSSREQEAISYVRGDLTDTAQVVDTVTRQGVTHIIHLAALQVPFCRANPVLGAQVNVVGTVNVFEAARAAGIRHLAYASSIAVYGAPEDYADTVIDDASPLKPRTLYGVYKRANEGTAEVYWRENSISSIALRPFTVYGVGRDQGLTSDPTKAMLAAAKGEAFEIGFSGPMQFQWASDVAQQFIDAATRPLDGSFVFNLDTKAVEVAEVVDIIRALRPGAQVTFKQNDLPFPAEFDTVTFRRHIPTIYETPLRDGIRATIEQFESQIANRKS